MSLYKCHYINVKKEKYIECVLELVNKNENEYCLFKFDIKQLSLNELGCYSEYADKEDLYFVVLTMNVGINNQMSDHFVAYTKSECIYNYNTTKHMFIGEFNEDRSSYAEFNISTNITKYHGPMQ